MKRIYLIVPLIGLLLFGAAYWRYAAKYEARIAAQKQLDDLAKQEKQRLQQAAQLEARLQANEAAERRKREREAEEQLEMSRKQERLAAEQLRTATIGREQKLRVQVERWRADADLLQSALTALDERRRSLEREREFLANYVQQAEGNQAEFFQLLEKLEAIERTRATPQPAGKSGEAPKPQRSI